MSLSLCMVVIRILKTKTALKRNRAYRKRRKEAHRIVRPQQDEYELIDGNFSKYVVGWCRYKQAHLTLGLSNTHKCPACTHYQEGVYED